MKENTSTRAYAILILLSFINVMNFVDRQLLPSFANYIKPELGLTNAQFGWLTGLSFVFFYSIAGLFMGVLADRLHRPRLLAVALMIWSGLTAVSGAARGFVSLLIPRMFIGIGESAATPTAMSMLADYFPAKRLGFAASIYYLGVPIGVAASAFIAGTLGPAIGWRNCFYLLGAVGLFIAIALWFLPETPRKGLGENKTSENAAEEAAENAMGFRAAVALLFKTLKTSPALACTIIGGATYHIVLGASGAFDQLWLVEERGFGRDEALVRYAYFAAAGGIIGNLLGGGLSDWWQHKFASGRPMFLVITTLLLAPFLLYYRYIEVEHWLFDLGMFLSFLQLGLFYGPTFSTVQELVPPHIRATIVAFYILSLNLLGLGIGATASGYYIDYRIAQGAAEPYSDTLFLFTAISLLFVPLMYIAGKRFQKDKAKLESLLEK